MSMRFLADVNFDNRVLRGARRACMAMDVLRAQDVGLARVDDDGLLEWAARRGRVVLSHDIRTLGPAAKRRIAAGLPMPGLLLVPTGRSSLRRIIEDLALIATAATDEDMDAQIHVLPL